MQGGLALAAGNVFAKDYRVERPLAAGGMGAVYVVEQLSTGRKRALKLMHPDYANDEDARRRFVLEARIGSRIESEHVVEVHAAGVDEVSGAPYLVMELLEGEDLAMRLRRRGPMSATEARDLFLQMCHALGLAHAAGIVHRDLKPPNIFLAAHKRVGALDFQVKVLDFGIAKLTTETGSRTGVIGTPLWMAPEQSERGRVTPAADVWSLGLILYTVLTGRSFWKSGDRKEGASIQQILREMLFDRLPPPSERAREQGVGDRFPASLEPIFMASVVRKPDARLPNADAFWAALDAAFSGAPVVLPRQDPHDSTTPDVGFAKTEMQQGTAFDRTAFDLDSAPSLELAFEPGTRSVPPASAPTRGAHVPIVGTRPPIMASEPMPPPVRSQGALLSEPRWSPPWWVVFLVPVGIAVGAILLAWRHYSPSATFALCRLCTVESKTFANGPIPLREVRNEVEKRFPELDKCVSKARGAGHLTIKFTIDSGGSVARSPRPESVGSIDPGARCFLSLIASGQYSIAMAGGETAVTYTIEYDPNLER